MPAETSSTAEVCWRADVQELPATARRRRRRRRVTLDGNRTSLEPRARSVDQARTAPGCRLGSAQPQPH
jgi:hypothetical protein